MGKRGMENRKKRIKVEIGMNLCLLNAASVY